MSRNTSDAEGAGHADLGQLALHELPVAQEDAHVVWSEAEAAQEFGGDGDDLTVGGGGLGAQQVDVPLKELAGAPTLGAS